MKVLILSLVITFAGYGQGTKFNEIKVMPNPTLTQVGRIEFQTQNGVQSVALSAPSSITAIVLTITAAANSSGVLRCTVSSTTVMLTGQTWYVTGITGSGFAPGIYTITVVNSTVFSLNGISASGSYSVSSATATQNTVWHLPSADGAAGNSLVTDGVGNLSWGSGTSSPIYTVPIISGVATPDLSHGVNQLVILTADTTIAAPINGGSINTWILITQQDNVGGHSALMNILYYFNGQVAAGPYSPMNTQCQVTWLLDTMGNNTLSGPASIDQPIP